MFNRMFNTEILARSYTFNATVHKHFNNRNLPELRLIKL